MIGYVTLGTNDLDRAVKFYDEELRFYTIQAGDQIPLTLRIYRAPCSEANVSASTATTTSTASAARPSSSASCVAWVPSRWSTFRTVFGKDTD